MFKNIASAEEQHFNATGTLLARYGVQDPTQNLAAGAYSDPKFNSLYNELVATGTLSIKDALEAGVLIEKADIDDLESTLKLTTKLAARGSSRCLPGGQSKTNHSICA